MLRRSLFPFNNKATRVGGGPSKGTSYINFIYFSKVVNNRRSFSFFVVVVVSSFNLLLPVIIHYIQRSSIPSTANKHSRFIHFASVKGKKATATPEGWEVRI